jgi:hypothetical protein
MAISIQARCRRCQEIHEFESPFDDRTEFFLWIMGGSSRDLRHNGPPSVIIRDCPNCGYDAIFDFLGSVLSTYPEG